MPIFGGDPRFVHFEILLKSNKYYDAIVLPVLIIDLFRRGSDDVTLIVAMVFLIGEILRICLAYSHSKGLIPVLVAFLILTFLPGLVFDFIWYFALGWRRTAFDCVILAGYMILHILEMVFVAFAYRTFSRYQDGFYHFAVGHAHDQNNQLELE